MTSFLQSPYYLKNLRNIMGNNRLSIFTKFKIGQNGFLNRFPNTLQYCPVLSFISTISRKLNIL